MKYLIEKYKDEIRLYSDTLSSDVQAEEVIRGSVFRIDYEINQEPGLNVSEKYGAKISSAEYYSSGFPETP